MAAKRREPRRSRTGAVFSVIGKTLGTLMLVGMLACLLFSCIFAVYVKNYLTPQLNFNTDGIAINQTSVIYCTNPDTGEQEVLQTLYGSENSIWASYDELPRNLIFACVSIEDKRFFDHHGVDWLRTIKASAHMFFGSGGTYGASTITQQLIKNLTQQDQVTVRRKLTEIFRALQFEKSYSKEEILELYMNTIYLGEQCKGVKSAARVYFGKDVSELDLAECASLIGITNNPSIYDPYINAEKNKQRQEIILGQMLEQGYIGQDDYDEAVAEQLVFQRADSSESDSEDDDSNYYSYFVDQVFNDVVQDLCTATGYDETVVKQMVRTGGYSIYSTINPNVQEAVDEVYQNLANIPQTENTYQQLQSGIVVIDNQSGDVVALAGGVGKKEGSLTFSRATQSLLSPGSAIKPLSVYTPAMELGLITPITVMDDTPYSFTGTPWPKNYDKTYYGLTTINDAVERSCNTIPVKLVAQMSPEYSFNFAKEKFRLSTLTAERVIGDKTYTDIDYSPLALGSLTNGVTVKAMAAAYESFADDGTYREARTYTKVVDSDGNVILDNTQDSEVIMKEITSFYMTEMLQNVVLEGTGTAAALDNMPVAGKTGTTTSDYDRWFVGYTPYYCAAVWTGFDEQEEIVMKNEDENPAISLWHQVMEKVHENLETKEFDQPADVVSCTYCKDSGLLATEWCKKDLRGSRVATAKLSIYDVPTESCDVHVETAICQESGDVANRYCGQVTNNALTKVGMLNINRSFPVSGIVVKDQQYVVSGTDLEPGEYLADTGVDDPANTVCSIHSAASIAPVETPSPSPSPSPSEDTVETTEPTVEEPTASAEPTSVQTTPDTQDDQTVDAVEPAQPVEQ